MQTTHALRELVQAGDRDRDFPYLDFLGAFLLVEKWVRRTGGARLLDLEHIDELLGLPLGDSTDDIKLGYVLGLLRNHGLEVMQELMQTRAPEVVLH